MAYNVAVLVGSLRKESFNRKMALALEKLAPETLKLGIVEIGGLALYNQDEDANPPRFVGVLPRRDPSRRCGALRDTGI